MQVQQVAAESVEQLESMVVAQEMVSEEVIADEAVMLLNCHHPDVAA